jgi:hypothetical protein
MLVLNLPASIGCLVVRKDRPSTKPKCRALKPLKLGSLQKEENPMQSFMDRVEVK